LSFRLSQSEKIVVLCNFIPCFPMFSHVFLCFPNDSTGFSVTRPVTHGTLSQVKATAQVLGLWHSEQWLLGKVVHSVSQPLV
jgi:hypothetical protein